MIQNIPKHFSRCRNNLAHNFLKYTMIFWIAEFNCKNQMKLIQLSQIPTPSIDFSNSSACCRNWSTDNSRK